MTSTISELILYTLKSSGLIENEALYNLKLEVVEDRGIFGDLGFKAD